MAYYDAYRNAPGWDTSNYQFVTPGLPTYQPQPNWRGVDYYRAHGALADPSIYDYAWNKVRHRSGVGLGTEEARILHRHAYGGLGDIRRMRPTEIGAAAAYEAWRNWKYHNGVYAQPLAGDRERQREALTGLAVSEATRLWQYTGRNSDSYGRLEACESAGYTADRILQESWMLENGAGYDAYPGRGRLSRRGSASSLRSHSPFAGIAGLFSGSRSRSRSRSRPPSPYVDPAYGYGGYSPNAYSSNGYAAPYTRRRAYSNAAAYPVTYAAPMQTGSPYLQPAGYTAGYAQQVAPAYGSAPITVIQPSSSHRHHRSHSHHSHRSGSHHRSSSRHGHRHSASYTGSPYYVTTSSPYVGY